jgi:hypothetical protein
MERLFLYCFDITTVLQTIGGIHIKKTFNRVLLKTYHEIFSLGAVIRACLFLKHLLFQTTKENSPFVKTNLLYFREQRAASGGTSGLEKGTQGKISGRSLPSSNTQHYTKCPKLLLPGGPFLGWLRQNTTDTTSVKKSRYVQNDNNLKKSVSEKTLDLASNV